MQSLARQGQHLREIGFAVLVRDPAVVLARQGKDVGRDAHCPCPLEQRDDFVFRLGWALGRGLDLVDDLGFSLAAGAIGHPGFHHQIRRELRDPGQKLPGKARKRRLYLPRFRGLMVLAEGHDPRGDRKHLLERLRGSREVLDGRPLLAGTAGSGADFAANEAAGATNIPRSTRGHNPGRALLCAVIVLYTLRIRTMAKDCPAS